MSGEDPLSQPRFSYRQTKSGLVQISYGGNVVTTLSGNDASRFLDKIDSGDDRAAQLAMAKATGNFQRGNERTAKRQGRGR